MFLSAQAINELIEHGLLENQQITELEGSMILLTVKQLYVPRYYNMEVFIGSELRRTPQYEAYAPIKDSEPKAWRLWSNQVYQVETNESINMPDNIIGFVNTRRTNFISALELNCTNISPGYSGPLMFTLTNTGIWSIRLEQNAPIAVVTLAALSLGDTQPYKHKVWKGTKTHTEGEEVAY